MDLRLPTRDADDGAVFEGGKTKQRAGGDGRMKISIAAPEDAADAMAQGERQPQPQPQQAFKAKRLDLANAVGGVDDGIEDGEVAQPDAPPAAAAPTPPAAPRGGGNPEEPTLMTADWYCLTPGGHHAGPLTAHDLKDLYENEAAPPAAPAEGQPPPPPLPTVDSSTLVWAKGYLSDWMQIERVPELYSFLEDTEALRLGVAKSRQKPAPPAAGEPGDASAAKPSKRKRKDAAAAGDKKPTEWFNLKVNTSVYVSELPAGTTAAQLSAFFKKVGVIKRDPLTNTEKVKVYDRGDGLVTFVRPESVDLAVQLLDGALFNEERHARVRVEPAKFEKKGDAYQPRQDLAAYDRQMKKAKKATESQQLAWKETDADPNARTVAVKNVFHPDEIAEQPTVSNVIKQDMREECAKFGHVENVRVLPNSAEGVVLIRFKSFISAQDCIRKFDGRMYAHQPLKAYMWDHEEQFETIEAAPPSKKQDADSFSGDELEC